MPTLRRTVARLVGIVLTAALVLSGCSAATPLASGSKSGGSIASAAPSIDTAAGIRYANAFVAALNKKPLVVHVEQIATGTGESGGQKIQVVTTMSADFAGDDMAFDLTATATGVNVDLRLRAVGKYVYAYQSGFWSKAKRSKFKKELAQLADTMRFITDSHDLRYLGEERVGKTDLQHFRANRQLPYDSGAGFQGHYDTFEIWVTKDGTPVRIEATFSASSAKVGTITGESVIDFTKFGGPIKVKVPKNKK